VCVCACVGVCVCGVCVGVCVLRCAGQKETVNFSQHNM